MEKVFVAQRVANKLFATEAAVDAAMLEVSGMMAELMQARKDLGLSATVGDAACTKVADAIQALAAARSAIVEAHSQLDETRLRVGIRTRMGGLLKEENFPPAQGFREVV